MLAPFNIGRSVGQRRDSSSNNLSVYFLPPTGYSIFVVRGVFPDCESDKILTLLPVDPTKVKSTSTRGKSKNVAKNNDTKTPEPKQGIKYFTTFAQSVHTRHWHEVEVHNDLTIR